MVKLTLKKDAVSIADSKVTQWDYGQELKLVGNIDFTKCEVHFSTYKSNVALIVKATSDTVAIPDVILATMCAEKISVYVYEKQASSGTTIYEGIIYCNLREKPDDYPQEMWESINEWHHIIEEVNGNTAELSDIREQISEINTIPSTYIQKNILMNSGVTTDNNGIQYVVKEDGSIIANGTATSDSIFWINRDLKIDNQMDVLISGCTEGSATSYFLQVGNPTFTPLNIRNINGENAATLLANTSYVARIVIKSGQIVNNLVFKPMIRRKNEVNPEYVPYVNDLCTRIIAIENNQKYIG